MRAESAQRDAGESEQGGSQNEPVHVAALRGSA